MITVYSYHYYDGQNQYNHSLSLWLLWWTELQCIIIFIMMDKINIILLQARVVWLHWILVTMRSTKYTVHITQYTVHTDISDFSFRLKIHVEFKGLFSYFLWWGVWESEDNVLGNLKSKDWKFTGLIPWFVTNLMSSWETLQPQPLIVAQFILDIKRGTF